MHKMFIFLDGVGLTSCSTIIGTPPAADTRINPTSTFDSLCANGEKYVPAGCAAQPAPADRPSWLQLSDSTKHHAIRLPHPPPPVLRCSATAEGGRPNALITRARFPCLGTRERGLFFVRNELSATASTSSTAWQILAHPRRTLSMFRAGVLVKTLKAGWRTRCVRE